MEPSPLKSPGKPIEKKFKMMRRTDPWYLRWANKPSHILEGLKFFEIADLSTTKPLMLFITELTGMFEPEICCRVYNVKFEEKFDFWDKLLHAPMGSYVCIEDPVKQLSTLHFDAVYLTFQRRQICSFDNENDIRSQQIAYFKKEMLPLLKKLRLVCNRLFLHRFPPSTIEDVLSLIRFSRLHTDSHIMFEEVANWPIFHCNELHLGTFYEKTPTLAPIFLNVEVGSIAVCVEEKVLQILTDLLFEIRLTRVAVDKLRLFTFRTFLIDSHGQQVPHEEQFNRLILPIVHLYTGTMKARIEGKMISREVSIYKLVLLNGGMAVVLKHWLDYEVHFVEDNRRESVLEAAFSKFFAYVPFDLSVVYDRFIAEEDEKKALRDLLSLN